MRRRQEAGRSSPAAHRDLQMLSSSNKVGYWVKESFIYQTWTVHHSGILMHHSASKFLWNLRSKLCSTSCPPWPHGHDLIIALRHLRGTEHQGFSAGLSPRSSRTRFIAACVHSHLSVIKRHHSFASDSAPAMSHQGDVTHRDDYSSTALEFKVHPGTAFSAPDESVSLLCSHDTTPDQKRIQSSRCQRQEMEMWTWPPDFR